MSPRDFLKTGHFPTLFSATLYFTVSFAIWVLMGVLGAHIATEFGLTAREKGLMVALPILGGTLVRIPLGVWVDRIGPRKMGICVQLLGMIPLVGLWLSGAGFSYLLAFGILLGVTGGSFAVALPLASRWYPRECQGLALGIVGVGNGGTVLASLAAPRLAEVVGWRHVFGLALIPVALTLFVFLSLAKESPAQPKPKKLTEYFGVLREADTFWFCLFYSITFGGFVGLASFLGIFFHDQYGLSKVTAGNFTALCIFAGSFARPMGGYLADRFGGVRMLTLLLSSIGVLMLVVSFLPPLVVGTVLILFGTTCLGMGNGAVFQLVPLRFQKEIGVTTGIIGAAGGLGGFLLLTLLGFFKDITGSYGTGFLAFGLCSLGALAILRVVQQGWVFPEMISRIPAATEVETG